MRNFRAGLFSVLIALALPLLVSGCRTLPHCPVAVAGPEKGPAPDPNRKSAYVSYVLEVNEDGFLLDLRPGGKRRPISYGATLTNYLNDTIFKGFRESGHQKMLVFIHGGMNDRKQGMNHFRDDYRDILNGEYYPVFVLWPSGWKATYFEHLFLVRQGIKAETPGEKTFSFLTSPFVLVADLGRAITRLPLVIANNCKSDLETSKAIRNRDGGAAVRQYQEFAHANYQVAIGDDYSTGSSRTVRGITYIITLPVKFVLASFIDGLGKGAWDNMLRRTQQTYPARLDQDSVRWTQRLSPTNMALSATPQAAATKRSLSEREERLAKRYASAGLPMFIETLRQRQAGDPAFEVTVVGHSMGSIILNRVIRDAQMNFANIIYMGAACSVADFSTSVLPYMKDHPATQFYNLSLHPVAEAGEWQPAMADLPPRGSLLVWIDNFLQNPVTEKERTFGRWRNLFRTDATGQPIIRSFYSNEGTNHLKERLHFQAFSVGFGDKDELRKIKYQWNERPVPKDPEQRCNNPLTHGEFTEMPYWSSSFWWQPITVSGGKAHQSAAP